MGFLKTSEVVSAKSSKISQCIVFWRKELHQKWKSWIETVTQIYSDFLMTKLQGQKDRSTEFSGVKLFGRFSLPQWSRTHYLTVVPGWTSPYFSERAGPKVWRIGFPHDLLKNNGGQCPRFMSYLGQCLCVLASIFFWSISTTVFPVFVLFFLPL